MPRRRPTPWLFSMVVLVVGVLAAAWASPASAQLRAQADSIGLGNYYRPAAWVPLRITVFPGDLPTGRYQLRVLQRDLDGQRVWWTREVNLSAGAGGTTVEHYFKPDPTRGLPSSTVELAEQLQIRLADEDGEELRQVALPPGAPVNVERAGQLPEARDVKVVLYVGSQAQVPSADYAERELRGVKEDVLFIPLTPGELPYSVLGYDMADAVLWGDEPPAALDERQRAALEDYVAGGGHLAILQRATEWQTMLGWGELLPVTLRGVTPVNPAALGVDALAWPLATWANEVPDLPSDRRQPFARLAGEYAVGDVSARPGALVEAWHTAGGEPQPYLARRPFSAGAVTYVAQDLTDPRLPRQSQLGWAGVWTAVFGWGDDPELLPTRSMQRQEVVAERWKSTVTQDVGFALIGPMRLQGRSVALVGVALAFFAVYWLVAGPGVWLWLHAKRRSALSWFAFAVVAVVATVLTLGITRLLLGGDAEANHSTVFRHDATGRATAESRVGLYIPRDGPQEIALLAIDEDRPSVVTPFVDHPSRRDNDLAPIPGGYTLPVRTAGEPGLGEAAIPYRSTLKKVQMTWRGAAGAQAEADGRMAAASGGIVGTAALYPPSREGSLLERQVNLQGSLTNQTGHDLENVFVAFRAPFGGRWRDWLLHVPSWPAGTTRDLSLDLFGSTAADETRRPTGENRGRVGRDRMFDSVDQLGGWQEVLDAPLRRGSFSGVGTLNYDNLNYAPVHLSLFGRLPVMRNPSNTTNRAELLRRNARHVDVSPAWAAGSLVVIGYAPDAAPPFPFTVEGEVIDAGGGTIFQAVLPLDHSRVADAARPVSDNEGDADDAPAAEPNPDLPTAPTPSE